MPKNVLQQQTSANQLTILCTDARSSRISSKYPLNQHISLGKLTIRLSSLIRKKSLIGGVIALQEIVTSGAVAILPQQSGFYHFDVGRHNREQ